MQKSNNPAARLDWDDLRFFLEVARTQKASAAARRLGVDYTTVSRRIAALEKALGALLFEKSRRTGFSLTMEGQRLLVHAETLESTLQTACEQISDTRLAPSGQVRIGATEGFGSYFVAPQLSFFQDRYSGITLEVLPVPHFVNLSRREADIAITLERPERGPYVCRKLCDYRLRLYATADYLASHPPIAQLADLQHHRFITYVDDLAFSPELLYLERILPEASSGLRSTSVIAQYQAALCGHALAILPCFVAEPDPRLVALLPEQIQITRQFWLYYREDLRRLRRITLVTDYLRACTDANRDFLLGETRTPVLGWPTP
ncbi:LysR family transcriptional regulator [Pseudomonas oryzihabitans]|uniref:LysR family transcriptional regulator n=1 Tax=Pseudomonas oryzihabitans TaxID=47885 RepID=UPI0028A7A49D|nr:LysR family transcriptional regulator [Pseudomonas oryzihabitans]